MISVTLLLSLVTAFQVGIGRTVLATVLDGRNQPIVDVEADDFLVREAGQPREVLSAHVADYPVLVLVDNGGQGDDELAVMRAAAARFITRIGQRPVALGVLAPAPAIVAGFDADREAVLSDLDALRSAAGEPGQLVGGMVLSAAALRALDVPFSAIVVISARPVPDLSEAPTQALRQVFDSHAMLDVVVNRSGGAGPGGDQLRALAEQTRGQLTAIYAPASYQVALDHLADQMASEMMIEYVVPGGAPPKEDVTVGVRLPGLRVKGLGVR